MRHISGKITIGKVRMRYKEITIEQLLNEKLKMHSYPRLKIFIAWVLVSIFSMASTAILSIVLSMLFYSGNESERYGYFVQSLMSIPFIVAGFFVQFVTPIGWISFIVLCLAMYKKRVVLLVWSVLLSLLAGAVWPSMFREI
jgi:hypothetical protein